jgi:hypothetical protein
LDSKLLEALLSKSISQREELPAMSFGMHGVMW